LVRVLLVSDTHRRKIQKSFQVEGIPLFGAQILALFLWVALAGLPVVQAFKTTSVVIAVCFWGVGLLRVFGRDLIRQADFGLWFFGPGLSIGALVPFCLAVCLAVGRFLGDRSWFPRCAHRHYLVATSKAGVCKFSGYQGTVLDSQHEPMLSALHWSLSIRLRVVMDCASRSARNPRVASA
jgi:hypothetical protein